MTLSLNKILFYSDLFKPAELASIMSIMHLLSNCGIVVVAAPATLKCLQAVCACAQC